LSEIPSFVESKIFKKVKGQQDNKRLFFRITPPPPPLQAQSVSLSSYRWMLGGFVSNRDIGRWSQLSGYFCMYFHFSCVRTKLFRKHGTKVHCIGESPTNIHRSKENYSGSFREKWALYRYEDLEIT
jgi:hypothetical protein